MKIKKKIAFISAAIIISALALSLFSLKLYFSLSVKEADLSMIVINFCKNNLGKAVKFDEIRIDVMGDVEITNLNLSVASDFNDNISLVKADRAVFKLNFLKLFKGITEIKRIVFNNATISLHKSYGKTYRECFYGIIESPR